MKKPLLFILLLIIGIQSFSDDKTDSLLHALNKTQKDTSRINILLDLGEIISSNAPDSSKKFVKQAQSILESKLKAKDDNIKEHAEQNYPSSYNIMGDVKRNLGKYNQALEHYRKSVTLSRNYEYIRGELESLQDIGKIYRIQGKYDTSLTVLQKGLKKARKFSRKKNIGNAYWQIGLIHRNKGNYNQAIKYLKKSRKIRSEIDAKRGVANSFNSLGIVSYMQGNYNEAIDYFMKTLKLMDDLGQKQEVARCNNNIGAILMQQEHYKDALEYYQRYLEVSKNLQNKRDIGKAFSNIGIIYQNLEQKQKAKKYYHKSLDTLKKIGAKQSMLTTLVNLGDIYIDIKAYKKAGKYLNQSLEISEEIGDKSSKATALVNLAILNEKTKNYSKAIDYARKSLSLSEHLGALEEQQHIYQTLSNAYAALGQYKKAYSNQKKYKNVSDSIYTKEKHKQIAELEKKYKTEKKEQRNKLLTKQNRLKSEKLQRQRALFIAGGIVLILLIALILIVLKSRQRQKQANKILLDKNEEIKQQKEELESQNEYIKKQHNIVTKQKQHITDSINYASRIQQVMLPLNETMNTYLGESNYFVYYEPRDIVSGDFYWFKQIGQYSVIVAADCTGHGVPGAFMSMLGISFLNEVVKEEKSLYPAQVLESMRNLIKSSLKQGNVDSNPKDGIDMALTVLDKKANKLYYAGAKSPLYYLHNGEIQEFKPTRTPIGFYWREKRFSQYTIDLEKGDRFYLFSDGFIDQFGGQNGSKFMKRRFKQMLIDMNTQNIPMAQQKEHLRKRFNEWRGNYNQIDDVLVMGINV